MAQIFTAYRSLTRCAIDIEQWTAIAAGLPRQQTLFITHAFGHGARTSRGTELLLRRSRGERWPSCIRGGSSPKTLTHQRASTGWPWNMNRLPAKSALHCCVTVSCAFYLQISWRQSRAALYDVVKLPQSRLNDNICIIFFEYHIIYASLYAKQYCCRCR